MEKLNSNGFDLVQTESEFSFVSFSEEEERTFYYQYNGKNLNEISKDAYMERKFGVKWEKISSQLYNPNNAYIESIANCWTEEAGIPKLISLVEYYNNSMGQNWQELHDYDWLSRDARRIDTEFQSCTIQNETICLFREYDIILHFNEHGELVRYIALEISDNGDTLSQICWDGQFIWGVSPMTNTVVKYMYPSFKLEKVYHYTTDKSYAQEQRNKSYEFQVFSSENELNGLDYPEGISYINGQLYICDMGNKRIVKFNPNNGKITPYISLDSQPFEFLKWKNQFVIQTNTGVYLLNERDKNDFLD